MWICIKSLQAYFFQFSHCSLNMARVLKKHVARAAFNNVAVSLAASLDLALLNRIRGKLG